MGARVRGDVSNRSAWRRANWKKKTGGGGGFDAGCNATHGTGAQDGMPHLANGNTAAEMLAFTGQPTSNVISTCLLSIGDRGLVVSAAGGTITTKVRPLHRVSFVVAWQDVIYSEIPIHSRQAPVPSCATSGLVAGSSTSRVRLQV